MNMNRAFKIFCAFAVVAFGIYSCKKDKAPAPDMGYDYFPNQVGRYIIYDVDSIYYDNADINPNTHLAKADTFKFQLKEKIESIYNDNLNRPTIRLERYIKIHNDTLAYSQMPWTLRNVWAENRTATTAEKVEENIRYIKLAFPVKDNQTWNGNAQNINEEWNYFYNYYDQPVKVRSLSFDSVLQVTQYDDNSLVLTERKLYTEKYARQVGLIYKQEIDIESQPFTGWNNMLHGSDSTSAFFAKPILQRITNGIQFTMSINSYGVE